MLGELFEMLGLADSGWEVGSYDDTLICPCGDEIETDGRCPAGHVSPLRTWGMI